MRRYTKRNKNGEKLNFWLSYSDMMAALLLVFILILSCTLLETRATYEAKQAELEEKEQIILNQQSQIDTIVGVRGDLIDALSKEFSGNDLSVKVDAQSGAITFDSTLLFGYNDDKLQDSGKTFLAEFLPKYFSVLLGKDFSPYVAEIIIEGHTDQMAVICTTFNCRRTVHLPSCPTVWMKITIFFRTASWKSCAFC